MKISRMFPRHSLNILHLIIMHRSSDNTQNFNEHLRLQTSSMGSYNCQLITDELSFHTIFQLRKKLNEDCAIQVRYWLPTLPNRQPTVGCTFGVRYICLCKELAPHKTLKRIKSNAIQEAWYYTTSFNEVIVILNLIQVPSNINCRQIASTSSQGKGLEKMIKRRLQYLHGYITLHYSGGFFRRSYK